MTQEEKELLLKDLSARLSYGIKCYEDDVEYPFDIIGTTINNKEFVFSDGYERSLEQIKPYLRPMSSMTEEEKKELSKKYVWNIWSGQIQIRYHSQGCWDDETECPTEEYVILFDWLNAHHFDYRGLVEMGLALEAPKDMYKI